MATKKTITKAPPLNSSLLKEVGKLEKQINNRHSYIVAKIANAFNFTKYRYSSNHYFSDLNQLSNLEDNIISYRCNTVDSKNITFKIDGEDYPFSEYYPSRWLFENFEQELESIKKEAANKALAAKKRQQEEKKMLTSLKKKLTAEEFDFLKDKI